MYLHIGQNRLIPVSEIIAIIDAKSLDESLELEYFLYRCKEQGILFDDNLSKVKSYVLVNRDNETIIYTSNISSSTLYKRSKEISYSY